MGSGVGGNLSRLPGKLISHNLTPKLNFDPVQVIGVDISPQMKPDETPENFEPQVCNATAQAVHTLHQKFDIRSSQLAALKLVSESR